MSSEGKNQNLNPNWWYLYGDAYDFSGFVKKHPGGEHAINQGKGRNCTALFESYHTNLPSLSFIKNYKVKPSKKSKYPISIKDSCFTFDESGFYRTIKTRAKQYFKTNGYANTKGRWYNIIYCLLNISFWFILYYFSFIRGRGNAIAAILFGICKALLVIRSTHAASHYSLSTSPRFNRFIYWIDMGLSGDTPAQWTAKHVIAHHIDTNITPQDDDTMYPLKRVLPSFERMWFHKYQHLYIWFLYSFVFYPWTLSHNIKVVFSIFYDKLYEGVVEVRHNNAFDWIETVTCILITHTTRILPFFTLPTWFDVIFISFIAEMSSSLWFSLQFAVNHEIPSAIVKSGSDDSVFGEIRDWGAHQLITSHNYSVGFHPTLELSGGLNYQIEHHLFPSVHFMYYPDLAKIVQKTAKEFNLPYNASPSFWGGVWEHYKLLKKMGNGDKLD